MITYGKIYVGIGVLNMPGRGATEWMWFTSSALKNDSCAECAVININRPALFQVCYDVDSASWNVGAPEVIPGLRVTQEMVDACAQSTLAAVGQVTGLDEDAGFRQGCYAAFREHINSTIIHVNGQN